jgi:arylsulfatase A-like enzyme
MNSNPAEIPLRCPPRRTSLSPMATILLAISFGICAGYLDVGAVVIKKYYLNSEGHFRSARDFPWTLPVGHAVLMMVPGVLVAAVSRFRPVPISLRAASWIFATLAISSALLRMPLYSTCSFLLAAGLGRVISNAVAAHGMGPRQVRSIFAMLVGVVGVSAALTSGRQAILEYRTVVGLSAPPPTARNVMLIVWDTVRADNLGLYGYSRNTTPNLAKWAQKGVTYKQALSPAPWTLPSHTCFFTGQWPYRSNSQLKLRLDASYPTLAERLASSGYQTAGFSANTDWCSYETGLDRGFAHFEDFALTPRSLLSRTVAGQWILKSFVKLCSDFDTKWIHDMKWIDLQSRGASEINSDFFQWLSRRRPDRPFFAFLNYFDAHQPYLPPPGYEGRFGIMPTKAADFQFLIDFKMSDKNRSSALNLTMARDCYDDCIAYLDEQLGRLLDDLERQGILENTDVIITADHGEAFGAHHFFGHDNTANLDEVGVPLVILSPAAPAGRVVNSPVSLRDLPATVVDLLGLSANSPFPGRSLSAYWKLAPGAVPPDLTSPAFSEKFTEPVFELASDAGRKHPGFQMSLVASGHHYVRDSLGDEELYDLTTDPYERVNLAGPNSVYDTVAVFRRMLLDVLTNNPGSLEVEKAYLATYRRWLEDLVRANSSRALAADD